MKAVRDTLTEIVRIALSPIILLLAVLLILFMFGIIFMRQVRIQSQERHPVIIGIIALSQQQLLILKISLADVCIRHHQI